MRVAVAGGTGAATLHKRQKQGRSCVQIVSGNICGRNKKNGLIEVYVRIVRSG